MTGWHWFATPEGAAALLFHARGPVMVRRIIEAAIEAERGAVVAWLRAQNLDGYESLGDDLVTELIGELADAIERGEHRR